MAIYNRNVEKRRILQDFRRHEEEVIGSLCRLSSRPVSPKSQMEQERRIRREIANSNERRRMQSINAGFQSLRALLPHHEGEKLSKAAILQQTTQFIYQIEQEKTRLLSQNCQLKRLLNQQQNQDSDGGSSSDSPLPKRKKCELADTVDDGVDSQQNLGGDPSLEDLKREMIELRIQLERERRLRILYEDQSRTLESRLYPERLREIAHQVQLQYDQPDYEDKAVEEQSSSSSDKESSMVISRLAEPRVASAPPVCSSSLLKESRVPPIGQELKHKLVSEDSDDQKAIPDDEDDRLHSKGSFQSSPPPPHSPPQVVPAIQQLPQRPRSGFPSTSRQNLETIVEAIRHLEGDHLFDDPLPTSIVLEEKSRADHHAKDEKEEEDSDHSHGVSRSKAVATDLSYRPRHSHVIRTTVVTPARPGVIVSAHS